MGSFHIPGTLLSVQIYGPHVFVMYDEVSTTMEYSLDNRPYFKNSMEGDCPLKPVLVYRLTPSFTQENQERWTIVHVFGGGGPPAPLLNCKF
jgi:hypothetical protein